MIENLLDNELLTLIVLIISIGFAVIASMVCTVLLGVFTYRDAKERNMDYILWTMLVLFIPSYIGLIVYLLERRKHPIIVCPHCGKSLNPNDAMCPQCMLRFKKFCPKCGNLCEDIWQVCPKCAHNFETMQYFMKPIEKKNNYVKQIITIAIVMVICVILLFVGYISMLLCVVQDYTGEFDGYIYENLETFEHTESLSVNVDDKNITVTLQ